MDTKNLKGINSGKKNKFNLEAKILLSACALAVFSILIVSVIEISQINYDLPAAVSSASKNISGIKKFSSEEDFKSYLEISSKLFGGSGGGFGISRMMNETAPAAPGAMTKNSTGGIGGGSADRVSETNVQVSGIDEPDIVKTDGKEIYFSGQQRFYPGPIPIMRGDVSNGITFEEQKMILPPYPIPGEETKIIKAFPPADLALDGKIDKQGDLLLYKNNLVVFSNAGYYGLGQEINGYDVSNPKSPAKKWTIKLDNNTSVITSRLLNGKIYLITKNNINTPSPCPFKPLSIDGIDLNIRCADIYHPIAPVPIDSTFIAMILNPSTGKSENTVSFVGSSGSSIIYVSENAIYASYVYNESIAKSLSGFIKENNDLFPSWLSEKVTKLEGYDISESSKLQEITTLIEKYGNSLSSDERMKMENETTNRMRAYYKNHKRDIEKTGIIKIALDNFQVAANGAIPGRLLNNFAMDEYQNNLRVATTVGSQWGIFGGLGGSGTANDVYVLDKNLKTIGSVKDLGETEQIYSVRFIEDKGYMVTFRQTDPFYVLDLANPKNPVMAGELKIPGYSSYLHPLDATHILGIGQEDSQVKISLFDVTDKNNPTEIDKYILDEYWSEVSNNYHAFLLDEKHSIFFIPGSKGGYMFSYKKFVTGCTKSIPEACNSIEDFRLELKKAISQNSVKRAIYINDYLYIIGDDKITVLNELDWEKTNELDLNK